MGVHLSVLAISNLMLATLMLSACVSHPKADKLVFASKAA
jgi:outer membrane murein-binding lipoprotein Lpp